MSISENKKHFIKQYVEFYLTLNTKYNKLKIIDRGKVAKLKNIKLILYILLIILTSALILTMFFVFQKNDNADAGLKTQSSAYTISGSGKISNDTYKAYTNFEIGTAEGLLGFARNTTNLNSYPRYDWSGKTITLTADINCSGIEWTSIGGGVDTLGMFPFKGVFDGDYHVIKNLYTSTSNEPSKWYDPTDPQVALFAVLDGATVKRVSVDGINIHTRDENAPDQLGAISVAGIANIMKNSAKVSECSVKNLEFSINNPSGSGMACGGIAAIAEGSCRIENCYVEKFDVDIGSVDYMLNKGEKDECKVSGIAGGGSLWNSIFAKNKKNNKSYWDLPSAVKSDYISYTGSLGNYCYYDSGDIDEMLTTMSISQTDEQMYWFYDETYNDGYPILSGFIKNWVCYEFRENSSTTKITPENIKLWSIYKDMFYVYRRIVPSDIYKKFDVKDSEVEIGAAILDVSVGNPVFEFDYWVYNSYHSAYFPQTKRISYKCDFINSYSQFVTMYVDGEEKSEYKAEVYNGGYIKMSVSIDVNNITTYTYEIVESNNIKLTIKFVMNSPKYTMAEDQNGYMDNGLNGVDKYEVTSAMTIEPEFCLKSYNIELK